MAKDNQFTDIVGQEATVKEDVGSKVLNPFTDIVAETKKNENVNVKTNLANAHDTNADDFAKVLDISKQSGLPSKTVERNRKEVELKVNLGEMDKTLINSPAVREYFTDEDSTKVAHDDIENLTGIEKAYRTLTELPEVARKGFRTGVAISELGELGVRAMTEGFTPSIEKRVSELEAITGESEVEGSIRKAVSSSFEILGQFKEGIEFAMPYAIAGGTAATIAGQLGPQVLVPEELVTVPLASGVGFAAGLGLHVNKVEGGNAFLEFVKIKDVDGNPIDIDIARNSALMVGVTNTALELTGLGFIAKGARAGVKHLFRDKLKDKLLKNPSSLQAYANFAKNYGVAVAGETGTEILQEGVNMLAGEIAKQVDPREFEALTEEEITDRLVEIADKVVHGMALLALPGAGISFRADTIKVKRAKNNVTIMESMKAGVDESKLLKRSPVEFRKYINTVKEKNGGGIENISIPADKFVEFFQKKGIDPNEIVGEMSADMIEQLSEATAIGGDLIIPIEEYITNIAPSEFHNELMKDIRLGDEEFTLREAEEFEAQREEIVAREFEVVEGQQALEAEAQDSSNAVFEDVKGQLIKAGQSTEVAGFQAALMSSFFRSQAERTGLDAFELFAGKGVEIRGTVLERLREKDVGQLDLTLDRIRAERVPTEREVGGQSLLEFLSERGGLQDFQGDLKALGADEFQKGKPGVKKIIQEKGQTLDDATFAAFESGFFPEFQERPEINDLLEAIEAELGGERLVSVEQLDEQAVTEQRELQELESILDELGIDIQEATNEDIKKALLGEAQEAEIEVGLELEQSFNPREASTEVLPENTKKLLPTIADKGKHYFISQDRLQAHLDEHGDGFLYRVTIKSAVNEEGFEVGDTSYEHKFDNNIEAKPYSFFTSREEALKHLKNEVKELDNISSLRDNIVMYRVGASDISEDFVAKIPSERIGESLHILSPTPVHADNTEAVFANNEFQEVSDVNFKRDIEGRREEGRVERERVRHREEIGREGREGIEGLETDASIKEQQEFFQSAFHGTPHEFDKFTLEHIGAGEGVQVFGWGLYFAENKNVAKFYKESLSDEMSVREPQAVLAKGKEITDKLSPEHFGARRVGGTDDLRITKRLAREQLADAKNNTLDLGSIDIAEQSGLTPLEYYQRFFDFVTTHGRKDVEIRRGRILQVELLPEQDEYLLWDKPLSEQSDKVKEALKDYIEQGASQSSTGDWIYNELQKDFMAERLGYKLPENDRDKPMAVSLYLKSLGIPGIKYFDGISRTKEQGTFNYVIFDEELIEIQDVFFQKDEEVARGSIIFNPERTKTLINLYENADLSTFLHESGHFFLEAFNELSQTSQAPQQIKDDMQALMDWFEVENFDQVGNAQHEQFAEAFEAYLMEGKAPSVALQSAFNRFKAWLMNIYRSIQGFDVEINDELRAIFDRMIATDEEIATAETINQYAPAFLDAETGGMTQAEYGEYIKTAEKATIEAEEELTKRALKEVTRERTKWWKEEREKTRKEVEDQVNRIPVYQAVNFLGNGEIQGQELPSGVKPVRISRKALTDVYGKEVLKRLPKGKKAIYTTGPDEKGVHQNTIAEMFGFSSGDELVDKLLKTQKRTDVIENETDVRMKEEHGDMLNDGSIEAEAQDAVRNDSRGKFLATELRILRRLQGQRPVEAGVERELVEEGAGTPQELQVEVDTAQETLRVAQKTGEQEAITEATLNLRTAQERQKQAVGERKRQRAGLREAREALKVDTKAIREIARRVISGKQVESIQPHRFALAEVRASKKANEAIAKRDYNEAANAKQQQMLNHYLYIEGRKAREQIDKVVKYTNKFNKKLVRQRIAKAGHDYLEQIDGIRSRYEFARSLKKQTEIQNLYTWQTEKQEKGSWIDLPMGLLEGAERIHYKKLTFEELMAVRDAIKNIETIAINKNKLLKSQDQRELSKITGELADSIKENWHGKERKPSSSKTEAEKKIQRFKGAFNLRKFESWSREMDGFKPQGPFQRHIFQPISKADDELQILNAKDGENVRDIFQDFTVLEMKKATGAVFIPNEVAKKYYPSLDDSLTRASLWTLALHFGNKEGRERLNTGYGWTDAQIIEALNTLEQKDWDLINNIIKYTESKFPATLNLEKRTKGLGIEKVEPTPFVTKFGEQKGGYFPLSYDKELSDGAESDQAEDLYKHLLGGRGGPSTLKGSTKKRKSTVGPNKKPRLDLNIFFEHLQEVNHDVAFREALFDVNRVMKNPKVRQAIRETAGKEKLAEMDTWLKDAIVVDMVEASKWSDQFFGFVRKRTTMAILGWKISTALIQPLGYTQTAAKFIQDTGSSKEGLGYALRGLKRFYGSPAKMKENYDFIMENSKMMRTRLQTFDRDIHDSLKSVKRSKALDVYERSLMIHIGKMQMLVDLPTWMGAYEYAYDTFAEGDRRAASDYADSTVRLTQGGGTSKDLAPVRRGGEFQNILVMFMTFFEAQVNLVFDEAKLTQRYGPKRAGQLTSNILLLSIIPALLMELLLVAAGVGGPDDDESWGEWAFKNWALFQSAGIPILRDFVSATIGDYPYEVSPATGMLKQAVKFEKQLEQGELDKPLLRSGLKTLATFGPVPLPTNQLLLTGEYFYDWLDTSKDFNAVEAFVRKDFK